MDPGALCERRTVCLRMDVSVKNSNIGGFVSKQRSQTSFEVPEN